MGLSSTAVVEVTSRIGRAVVALLMLTIFIRLLGATVFGIFILFEAIIALTSIIVDGGIGSAIQKRVSEENSGPVISTALIIKISLLILTILIIAFFRTNLNRYFGMNIAIYLIPAVAAQQLGRTGLHVLRGELRVDEAALIQLMGEFLILCFGVGLVLSGDGLIGLINAYIIGWVIISLVSFIRLEWTPERPSRQAISSIFQFSKYTFVANVIGGAMYTWVDTLVIGFFLTSDAVAAYETAWRISMAVVLVPQAIGTSLFPQVSKWAERDQLNTIKQILPDAISGALFLVFPAIIGALIVGENLLEIVFDPSVTIAASALIVLLIGKISESLNTIAGRVLYGLDKPQFPALAAFSFVIINLILNVILVLALGIFGAAVATTLSFSIASAIDLAALNSYVRIKPDWPVIGMFVVSSSIMGFLLMLLHRVIEPTSGLSIVIFITIGGLIYLLGVFSSKTVRKRFFDVFESLVR